MRSDSMSVVDGEPKACGIENLRIADGFVMPRATMGTAGHALAAPIIARQRRSAVLGSQVRGIVKVAPSCCISEKRFATPQCSVILPF
jgi:hypothetical protein